MMKKKLELSFLSMILVFNLLLTASSESEAIETIKIGAILDLDSRLGKEQHIAMEIAVENFNTTIQFIPYNQTLFQIAIQVETLIKKKKVEVIIIGVENWQGTSLVAKIGALAQVPVLSLVASSPLASPFPSLQWPFLVQMSHNATQQVQNIASLIKTYLWRKIIVVYEDDIGSSNRGTISLLTQALQIFGAKIEHQLVLPPFSSTVNTKGDVREELKKFIKERCYSRVFVVLRMSTPFVGPLFEEAKEIGLMRNDSVWITMDTISDLLPSFDISILSNMEGVIGIMTKFDNSTIDYQVFEAKFGKTFLKIYDKENYYQPSHQALLAYDAIDIIERAKFSLMKMTNNSTKPKSFLNEILLSNFTGLSGQVLFNQEGNNLAKNPSTKLVNVGGASYYDLMDLSNDVVEDENNMNKLTSQVKWPSRVKGAHLPNGWVMPTYTKPMRIGVPVTHNYKSILNYQGPTLDSNECFPSNEAPWTLRHNNDFSGYCISIFEEVVKLLESKYELPYKLIPFNCSYDSLVDHVHRKTFDAAVGDMTILFNRTDIVDFTQPFEESGLSIILPVEKFYNPREPWIFLKPFTQTMWIVTFFVFLFTIIIIWVLEYENNNEAFQGPMIKQLSTTAWFGFNSFYFTHREKISSKLARVVVILWLFIVLILTQSYTANLTSMITNERLNQTIIDVEMLQRQNAKVGYDNTTFVNMFLEDLLRFNPSNTIGVNGNFEDFHQKFKARKISAACLEYPYAKLFVSQYCNQYIMTQPIYRFGGFGFVFPKGSPITLDVSEALLTLITNGKLKQLEKEFLINSGECISMTDDTYEKNDGRQSSLSLESFQILFYMSGGTSTLCLLASLVHLYINRRKRMRNLQAISKS